MWVFVAGIIIVSLSVAVLIVYQKRLEAQTRQQLGLAMLSQLQALLTSVQTHRGVSTGFLKGAKHERLRIEQLQRTIADALHKLSALFSEYDEDDRWARINGEWSVIRSAYSRSEAYENFERHNRLIGVILDLIEGVADEHGLNNLSYGQQQAPRVIWKQLLATAEYVGQARAIGNGVATAGVCDSVSRIRLSYLQEKIETSSHEVWEVLPVAQAQRDGVRGLLHCISENLLGSQPSVAADAYFRMCTQVMEQLYVQFDRALAELQKSPVTRL